MKSVLMTSQGKALKKDGSIVGFEPQFVDYIWPAVGVPRIKVDFAAGNFRMYAHVIFREAIPNDNNAFFTLYNGGSAKYTGFLKDKRFRMWNSVTSSERSVNVYASVGVDYTVDMTPDVNLNVFAMGVGGTWSGSTNLYQCDAVEFGLSGTAAITIAYGAASLYYRLPGSVYQNIASLRPCRYMGKFGMWDTLSDTFYGNTVEGASWAGGSVI